MFFSLQGHPHDPLLGPGTKKPAHQPGPGQCGFVDPATEPSQDRGRLAILGCRLHLRTRGQSRLLNQSNIQAQTFGTLDLVAILGIPRPGSSGPAVLGEAGQRIVTSAPELDQLIQKSRLSCSPRTKLSGFGHSVRGRTANTLRGHPSSEPTPAAPGRNHDHGQMADRRPASFLAEEN